MDRSSKFVAERVPNLTNEKTDIWTEVGQLTKKHSALNFGMGRCHIYFSTKISHKTGRETLLLTIS